MIDSILVSPTVHLATGTLTLVVSILTLVVTGWAVWQKRPFSQRHHLIFILFQLSVMVQALVGIKLLDQGAGPLQLYIHYLGGLAPLGFSLLFYWLPAADAVTKSRRAATVTGLSFLFVLMTFAIGSAYSPGGV